MNSLTIAIITKDRPHELQQCLTLLSPQSKKMNIPIIIYDNNHRPSQKDISAFYGAQYHHTHTTIPQARNIAITTIATKYLLFIDDDCSVSPHYCRTAIQVIHKYPETAYFIGNSQLANPQSHVAQAQYVHYQYWFHKDLPRRMETGWNFDTKNCILNLKIVQKHHLSFDSTISINGYDSADTDFGFQLAKNGVIGRYESNLLLFHQEKTDLISLCRKAILRGRLAWLLNQKWHLNKEFVDLNKTRLKYRLQQTSSLVNQYAQYASVMSSPSCLLKKLAQFALIKIYEECYLQGYLFEKRLRTQ